MLAVVSELHARTGDFDAGSGARGFFVLGLLEQRLGEIDVGLRSVEVGVSLNRSQIRAGDLRGHLLGRSFDVGFGGSDAGLGSLIAADGAEIEDALLACD